MKKTAKEIEAVTGIATEKVEILADELDRIQDLKAMFRSDAGQSLIKTLVANCNTALRQLYEAKDVTNALASYRANIDLLSELQDISAEEEIARQLDEAVKEASTLGP